jgi:hypothetical protein
MKTEHQIDPDEPLLRALRKWEVSEPLPPRFREQVWQRIARAEMPSQEMVWARLSRLIEAALPRPRFAIPYLAALLLLGVVAGSWAAQIRTSRLDATLSSRYLQSLDPFASVTTPP